MQPLVHTDHPFVEAPAAISGSTSAHPPLRRGTLENPALVLCSGSNGLGAIRSLARAGVPTIAVGENWDEPGLVSRYPQKTMYVSGADRTGREASLLRLLANVADRQPVLIPTSDFFASFLARHRKQLARSFHFCLPAGELIELLIDKDRETREIQRMGIPLPKTLQDLPPSRADFAEALGVPCIIKPRTFRDAEKVGRKNFVLRTPADVESFYRGYGQRLDSFIAQELIPGADEMLWVCNGTFNHSHDLIEGFTFRRLRLCPSHFGVTSYAISERNDEVLRLVARLGKSLKYTGPAMVEFKFDARDETYKYIELNPRLGLCNFFDTTCGINNVWHTYRLALGIDVAPSGKAQQEGVMYLSLLQDLPARLSDGESLASILHHYFSNRNKKHVEPFFNLQDLMPVTRLVARIVRRRILGRTHAQENAS